MLRGERERPFLSDFANLKLLRQDGSLVSPGEAFQGKKYVLVYFAAHWCPPCQRFTPILADFYNDHSEKLNFEVLFVSSDKKEHRMMDFFQNRSSNYIIRNKDTKPLSTAPLAAGKRLNAAGATADATHAVRAASPSTLSPSLTGRGSRDGEAAVGVAGRLKRGIDRTPISDGMGNWLAVPFTESKVARTLSRRFGVAAIPKLVVVDAETGRAITKEGKTMVYRDENAEQFPWPFADDDLRRAGGVPRWRQIVLVVWLLAAVVYFFYAYLYSSKGPQKDARVL